MLSDTITENLYKKLFNDDLKVKIEKFTLYSAGLGFLIHLFFVFLEQSGLIGVHPELNQILANPIAAVYTPFSIILIYEVYLLVYYLPKSFSIAVAKQYEIISLILIRKIFKDISNLSMEEESILLAENLTLMYDIIGFILLFLLIFLFRYLLVERRKHTITRNIQQFIWFKKTLCVLLIPLFLGMSLYSFVSWLLEINQVSLGIINSISNIDNIFYHDFFVALIIVDVFILIASFRYTDRYSLLIRNTGFVISTVLIRLSFTTSGLSNILLILSGVLFGVIILWLYSKFDEIDRQNPEDEEEDEAYI